MKIIKITLILSMMFGFSAACESETQVASYNFGCPFSGEGFEQTYHKDDLVKYEKHLSGGIFDTVEVYLINDHLEGLDFTSERSLTNEERGYILDAIHKKYGKTEYLIYGTYSRDIDKGLLATVSFMPDSVHNDGKASLLYISKVLMQRLDAQQ